MNKFTFPSLIIELTYISVIIKLQLQFAKPWQFVECHFSMYHKGFDTNSHLPISQFLIDLMDVSGLL